MVIFDDPGVGRQELVVRAATDQGVVMVSRLWVVEDEADGDVATFDHRLVEGLHWTQPVGRRGTPKPFDSSWRVRAPDLTGDVVVEPRGEGLQGTLNFSALRWNCKIKNIIKVTVLLKI